MSDVISPKRIHRLPQSIADQIAAGEVIERPASVVKELLENSLDAGSTDIRIEVENGGSSLIRVVDNGSGIHKDDLLLSIDRHATSKIQVINDLTAIQSLGFRGEALASIAAVAGFRLISRTRNDNCAYELIIHPGEQIPEYQPAAHLPGTTVEIRELFSNIPARKKFLKSEKTELIHILALVKRMALSSFNTRYRFLHNRRNIFHCIEAIQNPTQRITDVCGQEFIQNTSLIEFNQSDKCLWGWLGHPKYTRSQTDQQYFYLNSRIIRDRQVNHAIRLAYQDLIHPGRHPVFVLYLEMDPGAVDINVHPTKHEVRFRQAREVHDFLRGSLLNVINKLVNGSPGWYQQNLTNTVIETVNELPINHFSYQSRTSGDREKNNLELTYFPLLNGRYILVQKSGQTLLVDHHLARESFTKNSIKNDIAEDKLVTRPLLVPLMINLSDSEIKHANENKELFMRLGISLEQGGPDTVRIREIPALLAQADILSLIKDLLKRLTELHKSEYLDAFINVMAGHVNDGMCQSPGPNEVKDLLQKIELLETVLKPAEIKKIQKLIDKKTIKRLMGN